MKCNIIMLNFPLHTDSTVKQQESLLHHTSHNSDHQKIEQEVLMLTYIVISYALSHFLVTIDYNVHKQHVPYQM